MIHSEMFFVLNIPVDNNFGKFARKIFFDKSGTMGKCWANFFLPPNVFLPVRLKLRSCTHLYTLYTILE
jgi:hypothetical protein